ncbi:MAG: Ig-like domain-containing protein, partial [Sideroxydans sp.]|nr:Ig-like domain-containing protein [Sideroxydans sp.]
MDEVAKIAVPTTTYNVATITGNATIDTTKDTFTSLTNNNSVVADSELYPTFTISAINDTVVTMGANNNGVVTLTGSPTFRIPQSETVATPVFCATFTALSKNFTTPLRVVFYDAGSSATIELSDLSYVLNDSSFTIPEEAKVSIAYSKNGSIVSNTYGNSDKGIFTATGNTVNLNMTAPMARTLFSTVNGMIADNSSYNYRLIFDLNLKVNGATYNELAGSLKAISQDTAEPIVSSVIPAADTTDVAVTSKISATFSKPMAASTINGTTFRLTGPGTTAVSGEVTYDGTTATFTPSADLAGSTVYTAKFSTGAKDTAGNALASDFIWSFTTIDTGTPRVISTVPAADSIDVAINSAVTATFSETMNADSLTASATFTLRLVSPIPDAPVPGYYSPATVEGSVTYNAETRTATFTPAASLFGSKVYEAKVSAAAKDVAGNAMTAEVSWRFTTIDTGAPLVSSISPAADSTEVAVAANPSVTFSEAMNSSTINDTTFTMNVHGGAAVTGAVAYNADTRVATFTPAASLAGSTLYDITITTGIKDAAGNSLSEFSWSFTTIDTSIPYVVSTIPAADSVDVAVNSVVTAFFSEAMDSASITNPGTFVVMMTGPAPGGPVPGGLAYPAPVEGTVSYNAETRTATFTPAATLYGRQAYAATISTAARDLAGNQLTGEVSWSFTTIDTSLPTVSSIVPAGNSTEVAVAAKPSVTFSEAMNSSTINDTTFTVKVHGGAAVTGAVAYNADTRVAIFTPGTILTGSTVYDVAISTGAKDLAGNAVASEISWSFTTIDTSIPYVISHVPAADSVDVAVASTITAYFSEPMDAASITTSGTFIVNRLSPAPSGPVPGLRGPIPVEGTVTYNAETRTATFTPSSSLAGSTLYAATISTAARDLAGNAMTSEISWNFTT